MHTCDSPSDEEAFGVLARTIECDDASNAMDVRSVWERHTSVHGGWTLTGHMASVTHVAASFDGQERRRPARVFGKAGYLLVSYGR